MKYKYESNELETFLNLVADEFVVSILNDAISGDTDYVPKY